MGDDMKGGEQHMPPCHMASMSHHCQHMPQHTLPAPLKTGCYMDGDISNGVLRRLSHSFEASRCQWPKAIGAICPKFCQPSV